MTPNQVINNSKHLLIKSLTDLAVKAYSVDECPEVLNQIIRLEMQIEELTEKINIDYSNKYGAID